MELPHDKIHIWCMFLCNEPKRLLILYLPVEHTPTNKLFHKPTTEIRTKWFVFISKTENQTSEVICGVICGDTQNHKR